MVVNVTYLPRRGGFEVRLSSDSRGELVATWDGADSEMAIAGDDVLQANVALKSELLSYASNEHAYRRLRSPEKRESHRKAAEQDLAQTKAIAELIERLGAKQVTGWCSGCFERATHTHVVGRDRPARTHLCDNCGTPTVVCAVPGCRHLAVVEPTARVSLCYCAEHHHQIRGFEKLNARLSSLSDYAGWLEFEGRNARRITVLAGGSLAGALVIAPMALLAAPAVGAALGGSALGGSLTGAAASSHGLAMLGGGSLAAGGLGMAGGAAVVTATGGALGGLLGGVTTSAYVSADPSFRIERLREGQGTPVILASGFLTQGKDGWGTWQTLIDAAFPESTVYRVHWGSKELKDLGALVGIGGAKVAGRLGFARLAAKGSKAFGRFSGIGAVLAVHDIATNPWTVAKTKAEMTGAILADLLARSDEGPYILVGHSLGGRVMVSAAQALGTRAGKPRVQDIHLLGAAVGRGGDWRTLNDAVTGRVANYWSSQDSVLRWMYTVAQLGERAVGNVGFAARWPRIKDRNVSRTVASHSEYFTRIQLIAG